jgi:hypothetical protein
MYAAGGEALMAQRYVILPGTPVLVSQDGGELRPHTLRSQLQFEKPSRMDNKTATFQDSGMFIVVDRKDVTLSEYNGHARTVRWGF